MKIDTERGAVSKATTTNPKDLLGSGKVSLTCVPPVALLHEACALMTGDWKYGAYNWRAKPVVARIYIDAALRHIHAWFDGEEYAQDSGVHHLGHARACMAILLDAMETGNLVDDRPIADGRPPFADLLNDLNLWVKGAKPKPEKATEADKTARGAVWQHFMEYIDDSTAGNTGTNVAT